MWATLLEGHNTRQGACCLARGARCDSSRGRASLQKFTPKATKSGDALDGTLAAKYVIGAGMETEISLLTSTVVKGMFKAPDVLAKGLTIETNCETPAPDDKKGGLLSKGSLDFDYKTGPFNCKAAYDFFKSDLTGAAPPLHRRRRRRHDATRRSAGAATQCVA